MRVPTPLILAAALAAVEPPTAARAQQREVMRDVYGFHGSSLDVQVEVESPGQVRFIRGTRSRIEVSGRATNGFASAALGGHGVRRLTLTALGADRVDFIVVVPEDVRVRVSWPGASRSELFGTMAETATFAWDSPVGRPGFETIGPGRGRPDRDATASPAPRRSLEGTTPRLLDIVGAVRLERLTLRIEDGRFAASANREFTADRHGDRLHIDAPASGDLTVLVPRGERFTLSLDGVSAIVVDGADVRVLCAAVLSQELPDGRHWLTLTPAASGGCADRGQPDRASHDRRT